MAVSVVRRRRQPRNHDGLVRTGEWGEPFRGNRFFQLQKGKDVLKAAYCATKSDVEVAF